MFGTVLINILKMSVIVRIFLTVYRVRETRLSSARETFARRRQRPASLSLSVDTQISYAHVTMPCGERKRYTDVAYTGCFMGKSK